MQAGARPPGLAPASTSPTLPALALLFNALVWGCSWWPFRALDAQGLHPLWATAIVFVLAIVLIVALRPRAVGQLLRSPGLWLLVAAAGTTNAAFNWAVTIGDVVRVVLLFDLMPLWAVLLARMLLDEPLTRLAALRVALALVGALLVLGPGGAGGRWLALPLPQSLADWLALGGGFSFALNNVMLRRLRAAPEEGRALAMFLGGATVSALIATGLAVQGAAPWPPLPAPGWLAGVAGLAVLFIGSNAALQYGAARLPAGATAVIMLAEVLFASLSAAWWGDAQFSAPLLAGGALIVAAALLAVATPRAVAEPGH